MNRIVIIGNGFDKAYGMKTSYGDFLQYLQNSIMQFRNNFGLRTRAWGKRAHDDVFHPGIIHLKGVDNNHDKWVAVKVDDSVFSIDLVTNPDSDSIFYDKIFKKNPAFGLWSDFESQYFKCILANSESETRIKLINEEFNHLKQLFVHYLIDEVEAKSESLPIINNHIEGIVKKRQFERKFEKNYFVTFNYTEKILKDLITKLRIAYDSIDLFSDPIHIHGSLSDPKNPIIFGYGDEDSTEYQNLENSLNDDLLVNFKTFQYLRTNKYRQVLGLLTESTEIYVQIIGHSCGLCDKALLKTIFEHDNVKNIEVVYHKDESKYFEKLYAISRIFDENVLMREKLVPYEDSLMIQST
ncbi:AbiH family protein [Gilvibacter sp.]|uniref:AbiH family protein n=1 Tax=Gilvibacter sp. TaxID=2729997 RepID=UPI003B526A4E